MASDYSMISSSLYLGSIRYADTRFVMAGQLQVQR